MGVVEKRYEGLHRVGKLAGIRGNDRQEARTRLVAEYGPRIEDLGCRTHRRDVGHHLVHAFGQERVAVQPVREGEHGLPLVVEGLIQPHDQLRPVRVAPHETCRIEFAGRTGRDRRFRGNLVQGFGEPLFAAAVERCLVNVKGARDTRDQTAAGRALVAFDEVQIGRGNSRPPRKFGLRQAMPAAQRTQFHSQKRFGHRHLLMSTYYNYV